MASTELRCNTSYVSLLPITPSSFGGLAGGLGKCWKRRVAEDGESIDNDRCKPSMARGFEVSDKSAEGERDGVARALPGKGFRRRGFWPGYEEVCALKSTKDGTAMFASDERFFRNCGVEIL